MGWLRVCCGSKNWIYRRGFSDLDRVRVRMRGRGSSKGGFTQKGVLPFPFTFPANVRMVIANGIALSVCS